MSRPLSDEKRRRILQAAVKVFARRGYFGARVSEIAHKAGVADGTIYLYFKSKEDILVSLFDEPKSCASFYPGDSAPRSASRSQMPGAQRDPARLAFSSIVRSG